MEEKEYLISEGQLKKLLCSDCLLCALENGEVDNWNWYGESIQDFIDGYFSDDNINSKDFTIDDIVEIEIEKYAQMK